MKNHLRQLIILFLTGFALLGQSCVEEERLPRPAFPADVTNRYALLLQEHLQADGVAYDRYAEILAGRTPIYEEVRFTTHSIHGLCYIIPYCSSSGSTIEGVVYLPAGATCTEDGTVTFDSSLGTPVDMDAQAINRDVPFTERYTYSMPFKHLQDKGLDVDPDLLLYADLLDNQILPLSPEDFPDVFIHTKTALFTMEICMHYESEYVGGNINPTGMHPDLLKKGIEHSLKSMGFNLWECTIQHYFLTMVITVPFSEDREKADNFIFCLMRNVGRYLNLKNFNLYTHCTYKLWQNTGSSAGNGGSSTDGGGGGGGPTESGSGSGKIAPQGDLSKAVFNADSKLTKQQWQKVEEALKNINNDCLGGRLIGEVKSKGIKIVHCDTMKANGSYNHKNKRLFIKNFYETDDDANKNPRQLESTLFHELLHSAQPGDDSTRLNREIEVRIAHFIYCEKYTIDLGGGFCCMPSLRYTIDKNYNIIDQESYDIIYKTYIEELRKSDTYKNHSESPYRRRNLETIQKLAKDCK